MSRNIVCLVMLTLYLLSHSAHAHHHEFSDRDAHEDDFSDRESHHDDSSDRDVHEDDFSDRDAHEDDFSDREARNADDNMVSRVMGMPGQYLVPNLH